MSKNLVIVESPAKAKTIEKYLGSDFTVLSSIGHIRAIPKKTKDGTPPVDVKNGYNTVYEVDSDKRKTVSELKKAVKEVGKENVWLATDEDREGEAIAWHLCEVLGLDINTTKRIVFHEITKSAIEAAVKNPRTIDMSLVSAQQARQILDRIVGFELSPVVWRKVPGGKSAGRVQSPAVRLLVERENEIAAFETTAKYKVTAIFTQGSDEIKAELPKKFDTEQEAHDFLANLKDASFTVSALTKKPGTRNPSAPFTTSTLQQAANSRLGFSSKATMAAAQKLYQSGKITYMRTDSVNLSSQAIAAAADYITSTYGKEYSQVRKFSTKSAGAQEAHEAIRPTDMKVEHASSNAYDQKLYDLIRQRTLASQMSPAQLEKTTINIDINRQDGTLDNFVAKGEVVVFDGFLKAYASLKQAGDILPPVANGDSLTLSEASARQTFDKPPARYSEGSLVKKLEELGIGRPSTYATIIGTVQTRGYAERGEDEGQPRDVIVLDFDGTEVKRTVEQEKTGSNKGKLVPTPSGELISGFLSDHFNQIVDYDFTARVEKEFDQIANDNLGRNEMLDNFYTPFHKLIEDSGEIDRSKVGSSREVGTDPKTGKPIFARFGRFGPMLQLGTTDDEEKPQFAPMPKGAKIETVTIEQALQSFKLPRLLGQAPDGKDIRANVGRFGPFIQIGTKTTKTKPLYVSLKTDDPHDVTLERALELYEEKLKAEAEKNIADFGDGVKVLNGRFGPYVTDGTKNAKIPKDTDPKTLTHEEAKDLLAKAPAKKTRARAKRKTTKATKTTKKK